MAEAGTLAPSLSYIDRSFTDRDLRNYKLLVTLGARRATFAAIRSANTQLMAMGDVPLDLRDNPEQFPVADLFNLFPWCKGSYGMTRIALDTPRSTLVPESFYDETAAHSIMSFNGRVDEGENVAGEYIPGLKAYTLYPASVNLKENLLQQFPGAVIGHITTPLIEGLLHFPVMTEPRVFLHLRDDLIDIAVTANGTLRYFNTFTKQTKEDVAYFLMFVLEQLGLDQEKTDLRLLGRISKGDEVCGVLFRYIRTLSFPESVDYFRELIIPQHINPGTYFPLLNILRCGS